ncbi:MAG: lactate racemase domain-containing protein [Acidobacteriota bacterium]
MHEPDYASLPPLDERVVADRLSTFLESLSPGGRKILVIIPDLTRTAPIPLLFRTLVDLLADRVSRLDFLVALGTHPPLDVSGIERLTGFSPSLLAASRPNVAVHNHDWRDPGGLAEVGIISRDELSGKIRPYLEALKVGHDAGLLRDLPVRVNRKVLEYDLLLVCGPTFPHEVVGFSGGNKYFFPGVSGPEVINYTHWLGAVLSCYRVIGTRWNPVRWVVDRAASLIPRPRYCISLVMQGESLVGLCTGTPEEAFAAACDLSAQANIRWLDQPVRQALSVMPRMYDDIWTAAKGMYKLEPVIADGGEVIIYAPHITEFSYTHGEVLEKVGYHVTPFFLHQWERYRDYPWAVLAHSTHLRGIGDYDPGTGREQPRIQVTLATGISEERCRAVGLGYLDPAAVDPHRWAAEEPNRLLVPKAGEVLYRLRGQTLDW